MKVTTKLEVKVNVDDITETNVSSMEYTLINPDIDTLTEIMLKNVEDVLRHVREFFPS